MCGYACLCPRVVLEKEATINTQGYIVMILNLQYCTKLTLIIYSIFLNARSKVCLLAVPVFSQCRNVALLQPATLQLWSISMRSNVQSGISKYKPKVIQSLSLCRHWTSWPRWEISDIGEVHRRTSSYSHTHTQLLLELLGMNSPSSPSGRLSKDQLKELGAGWISPVFVSACIDFKFLG